jgi:sugar phosphate isomerase/epimerase
VRIEDMTEILRRISSEAVGVCVDTGNSIALLEDPMEVVEAYAKHAMSVHLKDMGVRPSETGFLLSEVPLGEGFLDLAAIVRRLRQANPAIAFSLEMITRDPLVIPVLTDKYWITMRGVPARDLARTTAMVRRHASAKLPGIKGLDTAASLALEEEHVRRSLAFAKAKLGL